MEYAEIDTIVFFYDSHESWEHDQAQLKDKRVVRGRRGVDV